jgi:hypothetical protein
MHDKRMRRLLMQPGPVRGVLLGVLAAGLLLALAAAYFLAQESLPERMAREHVQRQALLDELNTVTLKNCTLKRYGSADDGGYLMCENLIKGVQVAYSYGIGSEDNWGCQVSRQFGVNVHQYDCFVSNAPPCEGGRFVFHSECVGARREMDQSRPFDTIAAQIAANGDSGKRLLLKIDVEGAEWESLLATPDHVLDSIDQIPMEMHRTGDPRAVELIRRLKAKFHLVNLHFNNYACTPAAAPLPSFVFQVLWVNKRIGMVDPQGASPAPMSPLNAPDAPQRRDCQLPTPSLSSPRT